MTREKLKTQARMQEEQESGMNRLNPKANREGREYLINKRFDAGDFEHDMRMIEKNQKDLERKIKLE